MRLKRNDCPVLKKCSMSCDEEIHPKLNKYELTKHMNQHSMNLFLGAPKSGKTSLLYSFFKSNKLLAHCFHTIYVFQPNISRASMKDKIFDKLPEDQLFDEITVDNLAEVMRRAKEDADSGFSTAIIFDDQSAHLKNTDTLKLFKEMAWNRRHLHISCFFCVQSWTAVPKELRRVWTNVFAFKMNKEQLAEMWDEIIEKPKKLIPEVRKLVFDKPYQFLFINVDQQRLYKCWDEIIFDDDEEHKQCTEI